LNILKSEFLARRMTTLFTTSRRDLNHIFSSWPFSKWGMDIIGTFVPSKGQVKFLLVDIDYFTKWMVHSTASGATLVM